MPGKSYPGQTYPASDTLLIVAAGGSVAGVAAQTLGAVTQAAPAKLRVAGTASQTLGAVTEVAAGKLIITGLASQTLGSVTQVAPSTLTVTALASQTLGSVTQVAEATVAQPTASAGVAAQTLGDVTQSSAGTIGASYGGFDWGTAHHVKRTKRRAKDVKREKEVEDRLNRLLGLVPDDPPQEIEEAVEAATVAVTVAIARPVIAPYVDYGSQIEALQAATLRLAKLDAVIRAYQAEEDDEDILLLSM